MQIDRYQYSMKERKKDLLAAKFFDPIRSGWVHAYIYIYSIYMFEMEVEDGR